jgi:hypothetical protein
MLQQQTAFCQLVNAPAANELPGRIRRSQDLEELAFTGSAKYCSRCSNWSNLIGAGFSAGAKRFSHFWLAGDHRSGMALNLSTSSFETPSPLTPVNQNPHQSLT